MGDDLDDLLDQVEDQFCRETSTKITSAAKEVTSANRKRSSIDDTTDLDQIIRDICSDDGDLHTEHSSRDKIKTSSSIKHSSDSACNKQCSKRCFPVFLGGSQVTLGNSDSSSQRACDQLRCTSCDFHVIWFDDHVWHSKSDYLFFRNNVPDRDKLKKYLVRKKGQRAYACQCSWHHVMGVVDLSTLPRLKWVCGKH